ncbi:MAG: iron-sulfur cluster insertion protein ErpA [Alphaproteobacteria bacterium]
MSDASPPITLTERAARRIAQIAAQEGTPNARLRIAVNGGGCSGFQYDFSLDDKVQDDDLVVDRDDAGMVIDTVSSMYLAGSEVDFVDEIAGSYFTVRNPNATSSCGCGASFGIAI